MDILVSIGLLIFGAVAGGPIGFLLALILLAIVYK
jgi:hypothetical protein